MEIFAALAPLLLWSISPGLLTHLVLLGSSSQKSSVRCLLFVILEKGLGKEAQKKHFADLLTFFYFYTISEIQWKYLYSFLFQPSQCKLLQSQQSSHVFLRIPISNVVSKETVTESLHSFNFFVPDFEQTFILILDNPKFS